MPLPFRSSTVTLVEAVARRERVLGVSRLGLEHGWRCLGCCRALMLLLFAGHG